MNTNEPLDVDPNENGNEDDGLKEVGSMLGQIAIWLSLLVLFGLCVSHCTKKAIEDGYIGSQLQYKQELLYTLDNQNHSATSIGF